MDHYIRDYWKAALGLAWRETWAFMRSHFWREVAVLAATLIARAVNILLEGQPVSLWRELVFGLAVAGLASFLMWLWHLVILAPARLKRAMESRHQVDEEKLAEANARHQSDQAVMASQEASLEEARLRITDLEASCATERNALIAARREQSRLAAEQDQARAAAIIVATYGRLTAAQEERNRLQDMVYSANAGLLEMLRDGNQESALFATCLEIRTAGGEGQPIEQIEKPTRALAGHFGLEALL